MKTDDILNIDAEREEGKRTLNKFLWKIKPLKTKAMKQGIPPKAEYLPLELIETAIHGLCSHYGYRTQGIGSYFNSDVFQFYTTCVMDEKRQWVGNVYGKTLWEIEAKTLIKIYGLILEQKGRENENS